VFASGFYLLHAQGGLGVAVGVVFKAIAAGVFVDFLFQHVALAVFGGGAGAGGFGVFKVKAGQSDAGGHDAAHGGPVADGVVFLGAGFALVGDLGAVTVDGWGLGGVVRQVQGVAVFAVFVPVVPAALFPAAVQVVVVALVILGGVGVGGVAFVDG
jgi:hypothetical protein